MKSLENGEADRELIHFHWQRINTTWGGVNVGLCTTIFSLADWNLSFSSLWVRWRDVLQETLCDSIFLKDLFYSRLNFRTIIFNSLSKSSHFYLWLLPLNYKFFLSFLGKGSWGTDRHDFDNLFSYNPWNKISFDDSWGGNLFYSTF